MLEYHPSRRIFHLLPGLLIIFISYIIPPYPIGCFLLSVLTLILFYMHIKRSHNRSFDIWYLQSYGNMLRKEERGEWMLSDDKSMHVRKHNPILPGAFFWLLGTTISSALFSADVARTSLLVLSVSDPFAATLGVWFSKRGWNFTWARVWDFVRACRRDSCARDVSGPTVMGSVACALATWICTYVYFSTSRGQTLGADSRFLVSIATAVVEAVAGRVMLVPVDDNLMIPLAVGGLITRWAE